MLDLLTRLYPSTSIAKRSILNKTRFYSGVRFFVRHLANAIFPLYFKLNNSFTKKHRLTGIGKDELIVTFTSFPARIDRVWLVVESIFRQTHKPDRLILWLSREQFASLEVLPENLLRQQERGLEIRLVDGDIRSYKKYYYTLIEYPDSDWIIIDDDVFYPSDLVSNLVANSKNYPNTVIFNRGYRLIYKDSILLPYVEWEPLTDLTRPSLDIFATGVGGVLYPAQSMHTEALNIDSFLKYCPLADDVWLYVAARLNNTKLVKTNEKRLFIPVLNKINITLTSENVVQGLNDQQIKQVRAYLKQNHYDLFEFPEPRNKCTFLP